MFGTLLFARKRTGQVAARSANERSHGRRSAAIFESLEGRAFFSASLEQNVAADVPVMAAAVAEVNHPHVTSVSPAAGASTVAATAFVSAEVSVPNGGVNGATLAADTVYLVRKSTGQKVAATAGTSGGGDVIVLKPTSPLVVGATYTFVITAAVQDVTGVSFTPFQSSFTVGSAAKSDLPQVKFDKAPQGSSAGHNFFGLTMGPDGRLYAATDKGEILRFDVAADGSLGTPTVIKTIASNNGGPRFVVGMAFDPASTAENPILWVTHSATSALDLGGAAGADWTGKVSRLSGPDLSEYHDAVTQLPRSVRDHVTDQCAFGPDGALYFCQPSESSMGRPDVIWGNRPEHLLSAAILRLDLKKLGETTLNARTADGGGTYDPFAAGAPLTIYAEGVRNTFDLVWHSNGSLYAPGNGSAAGGNTPAGDGAPELTNVGHAETDYLFRIQKGGYYGHPNPEQGHYILNGGNPTSGKDPYEVVEYPVGTQPDAQWKPAAFNMGEHESPDGAIEYHGNAFSGALDGKLLICRYSGGDDIVAIGVNADGSVSKQYTGMSGMTGLTDPVDLIEDPRTGNIYVSELGQHRITLLHPADQKTTVDPQNQGGDPTPTDGGAEDPTPTPTDDGGSNDPTPVSPPPPPVVVPPVVVTPAPPLSRADRKLLKKIDVLARQLGSASPQTAGLSHVELKETASLLKKIKKIAHKTHQPAPSVSGLSLDELRALVTPM
jgi:glucose/arabinose dehydrogenase